MLAPFPAYLSELPYDTFSSLLLEIQKRQWFRKYIYMFVLINRNLIDMFIVNKQADLLYENYFFIHLHICFILYGMHKG